MGLAPPTRREILLVCLLLGGLFLIFVPKTGHHFVVLPPPTSPTQRYSETPSVSAIQQNYNNRLTWGASGVPQTKIIAHVPGWSIIDRLYFYKGVVFIVSDEPHEIPDVSAIYSKGVDIQLGEEAERARLPDDNDIRIISAREARALFGSGAQILDGVTVRPFVLYLEPTYTSSPVLCERYTPIVSRFCCPQVTSHSTQCPTLLPLVR